MAELINGRSLATKIRATLPARIQRLPRRPGLGVLLIGNDHASELYVKLKERAAKECGIQFVLQRFSTDVPEQTVLTHLHSWNNDPRIDAILIQLPVPNGLHEDRLIASLEPEKDADGFHPINTGRYLSGERTNPPGLVEGILRLLQETKVKVSGQQAVIIARETIFTKCLAHALTGINVESSIVPPDGQHQRATLAADIVVVAAGRRGLIVGNDIKPGSIIIDIGINQHPNGGIVGDVDVASVGPVAGWLTPVPGGVGPMTIAMLLENTVRLAEKNQL